eukprot:jgi/Bigna1/144678/aug1.90_g19386
MYKYQLLPNTDNGVKTDLCDFRRIEALDTTLPATEGGGGNATVVPIIVDSLGARTQAPPMSVKVTIEELNIEENLQKIDERLRQGDTESFSVLVTGAAAVLNTNNSAFISNSNVTLNGTGDGGGQSTDGASAAAIQVQQQQQARGDLLDKVSNLMTTSVEGGGDSFSSIDVPARLIEQITRVPEPKYLSSGKRKMAAALLKTIAQSEYNSFSEGTTGAAMQAIDNVLKSSRGSRQNEKAISQNEKDEEIELGKEIGPTLMSLGAGIASIAQESQDPSELKRGAVSIIAHKPAPKDLGGSRYYSTLGSTFQVSSGLVLPPGINDTRVVVSTVSKGSVYPGPLTGYTVVASLFANGEELKQNNVSASSPYRLEIPLERELPNEEGETTGDGNIEKVPTCFFWDKKEWSGLGVQTLRENVSSDNSINSPRKVICASTHLTVFSIASTSTEIDININTFEEKDVRLPAFSFANPAFSVCFSIVVGWVIVLAIGTQFDSWRREDSSNDEYWAKYNSSFHLRFFILFLL